MDPSRFEGGDDVGEDDGWLHVQVGFNNFYLPYEFNQKHLYCYEVPRRAQESAHRAVRRASGKAGTNVGEAVGVRV